MKLSPKITSSKAFIMNLFIFSRIVSLGILLINLCFTGEFTRFTREFARFTREFARFTREFARFTREFGHFTREFIRL